MGDLRQSPLEENKKRSSQIFREVSGVFQQNFNGLKNHTLSSSRDQGNFRGLEALRPRPRTSKCVLEDSTSGVYYHIELYICDLEIRLYCFNITLIFLV